MRLLKGESSTVLNLFTWDGATEVWDRSPTNTTLYGTRHKEYRGELVKLTDGSDDHEWTTPGRLVYRFRNPDSGDPNMDGRLLEIRDYNSNHVQIAWNEGLGNITKITDTVGGNYDFNYDSSQLLTNISFQSWRLNFTQDPTTRRLLSKTLTNTSGLYTAANTTWQFQYANSSNGPLVRIVDPRGITNIVIQYDQYGRQTNQVDAIGRATTTRYGVPGKRQITHIDPGTNSWIETYDRKGHLLAQQDPLANLTSYTYDTNGNRLTITEPLGWMTSFGYDTRANVIARTNALGEVTRWTFHPFFNKAVSEINPLNWTNFYAYDAGGNLTNHSDALGSLVRYTYATNGLVLASTDANGNTSQFAYDTNGFLTARTDAATNTWQFTVNDVAWKLAEINPFNDTTSYTYDLNGNALQTTDPLNRTFTRQYDANGNLLAQSDGKNQFTRHAYDAANQRIATTNRVGSVWQFTFTSRGKPDRSTDPFGNTTTNFYDSANRLIAAADPLGNTITNQFDANGNSVALFDVLGQRWSKTFDRLNRVIAESDPLGDTRTTTYDPAGRIAQITTPNGYPSTHTYDGRGRLTKWVDPENFQWLYAYDGNANITNITDALTNHYIMTYGPRNERTLERNQDNFEWQYTYDQLLRLKTQRDPNLTLRTRNYDSASRVTSLTLSTGREDTYTPLDDNDNPRVITRRVNGIAVATTLLTYDTLDRATHVVDPNGQPLDYGFDALSRVVSVTYPGNHTLTNRYDALSRLTNQVDWAARQMSYDYDQAGRLIRRAYPNGVVQTNTFDTAGRLTGLSHSSATINSNSINVALTYAYDRNGNKTGNSERGTFAWPLPSLVDETSRFTASGRITNRVDALSPTNNFTYQYDASGNMTNAFGGGQNWKLSYDEDNRVSSLSWDCGLTHKDITNRYDALGRRIARKVDSVETRYVLDLSGGMERILCDTTASGQITAWYIHGPDLCYRVDATNNVLCYHADAQANIISVTDGGGTNVAQYAYTPYGRSLGSTNLQSQISNPYLFVGSQGVMEELPGLYFMRARYYSADAGVFLSTDPVKKIGPGWQSVAYNYGNGNPNSFADPNGEFAQLLIGVGLGILWGGGSDLVSQVMDNGWENVDWAHFRMKAAIGGLKGFAAGATLGISLVADVAFGAGEEYLDNAYKNLTVNKNFNSGASGAITFGATKGILDFGIGEGAKSISKSIFPNLVGGQVENSYNALKNIAKDEAVERSVLKLNQGLTSTVIGKVGGFASDKIIEKTANAYNQPTTLNSKQANTPASPTSNLVSTSGGGSGGSGGSLVPKTGGVTTPAYIPPSSPANKSSSSSSGGFWSNIWSGIKSIFGKK